jgi:phage FluMu gp28-like protein
MQISTNFNPYPKQQEVLASILDSEARHHVLVSSRQVGKTLLGLNLLLYYAINYPDSYNVLVSPVFAQSKKTFEDLVKAAGVKNPIVASTNSSDLIMRFRNGSLIRMVSGESDQNLRGFTVSGILVVDEAAFLPEHLWNYVLRPTTIIMGKKVLFISTPNGPNWFKDIYDYGIDPVFKDWISYRITSYDNPYLDKEILEMARLTLPEKAYQQEYLGVFVEGGGSVFEFGECALLPHLQFSPKPGVKYYAGLDLALSGDFTVLTVLDDEGNLVDFFRENKTSWESIVSKVAEKIKKWNCFTLVEKNSIGSVIYEQLQKLCGPNNVGAFITTQDSKQDIIEDLKLSFAKRHILIPTKDVLSILHLELSTFTYKMLPSGKVSYSAPSGMTDDCVMSLAIANRCLRTKKSKGTYAVYSGGRALSNEWN